MQSIDAGLIPPEVDITSPAWFDVLYADRLTSPVPVIGRVAAKRAQTYDYRVEWAPGVEPADSAFQPILDWVKNVSASTTTGGDPTQPLAMIDPRRSTRRTSPTPTRRSSTRTTGPITLRVVAVAHYASGDVAGRVAPRGRDRQRAERPRQGARAGLPAGPGRVGRVEPEARRHRRRRRARRRGRRPPTGASTCSPSRAARRRSSPGFPFHAAPLDGLNSNLGSEPNVPSLPRRARVRERREGRRDRPEHRARVDRRRRPRSATSTATASPTSSSRRGRGRSTS